MNMKAAEPRKRAAEPGVEKLNFFLPIPLAAPPLKLPQNRQLRRLGHTVSNIIVMAFSPRDIVCCLLKKSLGYKGGGRSQTPQDPPRYALNTTRYLQYRNIMVIKKKILKWSLCGNHKIEEGDC